MQARVVDVPSALQMLRVAMDASECVRLSDGASLLEHSLWSAHQAVVAGCDGAVIVAALFHDIGHYLCAGDLDLADYYKDREHAALGGQWLARWFPCAVTVPVVLHVDAKRYLATVDEDYRRRLGGGSLQSLEHQGGLMSQDEVRLFRQADFFQSALLVRRFDDAAYGGESLPSYSWYERIVSSVMA